MEKAQLVCIGGREIFWAFFKASYLGHLDWVKAKCQEIVMLESKVVIKKGK